MLCYGYENLVEYSIINMGSLCGVVMLMGWLSSVPFGLFRSRPFNSSVSCLFFILIFYPGICVMFVIFVCGNSITVVPCFL